jgi:hypothetical protein
MAAILANLPGIDANSAEQTDLMPLLSILRPNGRNYDRLSTYRESKKKQINGFQF